MTTLIKRANGRTS